MESNRQKGSQGIVETRLSENFSSEIEVFVLKHELTLNALIQGSWSLLLSQYCGLEDIVYGVTRSGRYAPLKNINMMIGLFINTLPIRIQVNPEKSVLTLLKHVKMQILKIRNYEHSPLYKVQQWSDVAPGTPLFDTLVVFEKYLLNTHLRKKGGEWANREFFYHGRTNYSLTLLAYGDKEILLRIEYDKDRFDNKSAKNFIVHLENIIKKIIAEPDCRVNDVSILTEAEKYQILVDWNKTEADYPLDKCLHELFEEQVKCKQNNIALVFNEERLTYQELNQRANQLAHFLRESGVKAETMVGLFMERSMEMVIGIYGILKAGGSYVPLDPEYPYDRMSFMLYDTQIPVILIQKHLLDRLPKSKAKVIDLNSDWIHISNEPTTNPINITKPENLAYVIYTSGSTGKPKGVMNEHRGIVNRLLWMQDEYKLNDSDCVLQKTPFSFDVSVWEFFWPLLSGANMVIAQPGGHRDSSYLVDLIINENVTTLHFVPSMLRIFLEEKGIENCKSIRRVICSGEALTHELQKKFFERLDTELHNLYGPTEAAVDVTYYSCKKDSRLSFVPIGRPVANTQTYILNNFKQPVPIGVPGELHIGGIQVARGYVNRPDLTAERFISDPFSKEPDARLYKTGDLCRYLPDGNIEYLDRLDNQVKIRGFRIELGEIEALLRQHPIVADVIVVDREDIPGDKRLVAYFISHQNLNTYSDELRDFLKKNLPVYMIPSLFIRVDTFPLTKSGKIDRKNLPAPKLSCHSQKFINMPKDREVQTVTKIWHQVLGTENIGLNDNFFDLGGHSLLLVKMRNKIRECFKREISVLDIFQHPTINELVKFLSDEHKKEPFLDEIQNRAQKQKNLLRLRRQKIDMGVGNGQV